MWKKHKIELVGCIFVAVGIVLALLLMVTFFEYWNIHVPGSREMWIGLIGAVLGGIFTLFGVLITLYRQEEADETKKRLENMPILGFEVCSNIDEADTVLTYSDGELITSGFGLYISKQAAIIKIRTVNDLCAFDFVIEGCAINGKRIPLGTAFAPAKQRIAIGEIATFAFDSDKVDTNYFFLLRFSYDDIFGNKYYQDLPFIYCEVDENIGSNKISRQIIEIRDVKQPIFVDKKVKTLEESAKEYIDYDTFV